MAIRAHIELDAGAKTFATGLLIELIAALRRLRPGDLIAVIGSDRTVGTELEAWCRFTRNSLVDVALEEGRYRWVIRCGEAPAEADSEAPAEVHAPLALGFGSTRISTAICAVIIAVFARRRKRLDARSVRSGCERIASEAAALGVGEIFVTGGEPFLLDDIGDILTACAAAAPTTVLTNGMLLVGRRLEILRALPRDRVTLQISLDSPDARAPRSTSWSGHLGQGVERHRAGAGGGISRATGRNGRDRRRSGRVPPIPGPSERSANRIA